MEPLLSEETVRRVKSDNCFDFIRYFFAFSLVIVHFCTATDTEQFWFVSGGTRVKAFFIITGFLVLYSYLRSDNIRLYARKRFNRIVPAYVTVIFFCFVLGAWLTRLPLSQYLSSWQTYKYLLANLCFLNFVEPSLPGVFEHNPMTCMNGSLWSMKVEVFFYLMVPFFVWWMRRWSKLVVILLTFLFSVLYDMAFSELYARTGNTLYALLQHQFGGQLVYFFGGVVLLLYFDVFCKHVRWLFPTGVAMYLLSRAGLRLFGYLEPLSFAMVIIGVAYYCKPLNFLRRYDNISYGIYLYHFPVVQVLVHFRVHESSILLAFVLTIVFTILLATISWHGIEKRWIVRQWTPLFRV